MNLPVIDVVIAQNEKILLEQRIIYLKGQIDEFHIFEIDHTFSGVKRLFFFDQDSIRQTVSLSNIFHHKLYVPSEIIDKDEKWLIESWVRQYLVEWSSSISGITLFCDVDEIPSESQVGWLKREAKNGLTYKIYTQFFVRKINLLLVHASDYKSSYTPHSYAIVCPHSLDPEINYRRISDFIIPTTPGAHFSYLNFSSDDLKQKYKSFSHKEMNNDRFSSQELLDFCEEYQISHRGWTNQKGLGLLKSIDYKSNEVVGFFVENFNYPIAGGVKHGLLIRVLASELVTRLITNRRVPNLKKFNLLSRRIFLMVSFALRSFKRLLSQISRSKKWDR